MTAQPASPWPRPPAARRAVIVGTGRAGRELARDLRDNELYGLRPVAVLDDTADTADEADTADLTHLILKHEAQAVVLATPGLPTPRFRALTAEAVAAGAVVRYLPWHAAALPREATGSDLRPLDARALIDGPPPHVVAPDVKEIVTGKRVLVTGAGSTLGSELCRQLHAFNPGTLFLLDSDEQALHRLRTDVWGDELTTDIRDRDETADTFRRFRPEVVFHAAGLRQAAVLERRPSQAVRANILTTDNLVRAAARHGTERFVLLSADADPASMLGASHRVAEAILLHATNKSGKKHRMDTAFAAVRIGDALDASGDSLLTTLADQISAGGPVTVSHPDAARCFATVEEAVALTLEAARMATGGEVYSLDLGEPTRITEVVSRFTKQYGLPEVPIRYVGQPHGGKHHPESAAGRIPTSQPQIFTTPAHADPTEHARMTERLEKVYKAADKNRDPRVRQMLVKLAG